MTVITTVVSQHCIVQASDSFMTQPQRDGSLKLVQRQGTKILPVPACRGSLAYYGLAGVKGWTTLSWLRSTIRRSPNEPEAFARMLAAELEVELRRLRVHRSTGFGIGIQFGAYERVGDYWIPELFHISNWKDSTYTELSSGGVSYSRDSFPTMFPSLQRDDTSKGRKALHEALQEGRFLQFNNGDPVLFNPVAGAFRAMVSGLASKGRKRMGVEFWRAFARRPVQAVSDVARDFVRPEFRAVGGRTRDLVLTSTGEYSSTSGDA